MSTENPVPNTVESWNRLIDKTLAEHDVKGTAAALALMAVSGFPREAERVRQLILLVAERDALLGASDEGIEDLASRLRAGGGL